MALESSLLELKARRAQMDVQILGLRRRLAEAEREFARLDESRRRGEIGAQLLFEARDRAADVAAEIERLELGALEIDRALWRASQGELEAGVEHVVLASLQTSAELDRLRTEVLDALRRLAEPLVQFQLLAERQKMLTARIRDATGKDNGYAAYIDTALFRTTDYDTELEFVVELLRRARVAS